MKNPSNLWLACPSKLGLTQNIRRQTFLFFLSSLWPLSFCVRNMSSLSTMCGYYGYPWEGKWQVSWCQLPPLVLQCEESDRNKAQVNSERLGWSGPCSSLSQPLVTSQHDTESTATPTRAAFKQDSIIYLSFSQYSLFLKIPEHCIVACLKCWS